MLKTSHVATNKCSLQLGDGPKKSVKAEVARCAVDQMRVRLEEANQLLTFPMCFKGWMRAARLLGELNLLAAEITDDR